jgi:tetratricopeptide (TPR) repeat protein
VTAAGVLVVASLLSLGAGGCGDMLTYASDSRQQGIKAYNEGSFADAAGSFNNAIRQDPRDYQSYYYLGRSYESLKQYHQAVHAYRTALDVMKNSLVGREDTAFRYRVLDGLGSAAAKGESRELELAAMQNRQQPSAEDEFVRGKIYRIRGDVDSAVEAYTRAGLIEPNNLPVAKELGLYLVQLGQTQQAQAPLKKAYVLNRRQGRPEDAEVATALRQVGVVPGPSLADEKDLVKPPIPPGPIAPLKLGNPFAQDDGNLAPAAGVPQE